MWGYQSNEECLSIYLPPPQTDLSPLVKARPHFPTTPCDLIKYEEGCKISKSRSPTSTRPTAYWPPRHRLRHRWTPQGRRFGTNYRVHSVGRCNQWLVSPAPPLPPPHPFPQPPELPLVPCRGLRTFSAYACGLQRGRRPTPQGGRRSPRCGPERHLGGGSEGHHRPVQRHAEGCVQQHAGESEGAPPPIKPLFVVHGNR